MVITLWVLITIVFFLFRIVPADPTAMFVGAALDPESQKMLKEMHGLDKPKLTQYAVYLKNLLNGNFGVSIRTNQDSDTIELSSCCRHIPVDGVK